MCWMTVMWWSLLTCPWKQLQKKYRTAGISRCARYRYEADLLVCLVARLQRMYAVMPFSLSVCVCVCVSLSVLSQCMCAVMPACALLCKCVRACVYVGVCVCVCVYRDNDEAFIDAYLSSVHSNGCEYLDLEEVLISCRTNGMRSCIPIVSLSPSSFQSRNVYLFGNVIPTLQM